MPICAAADVASGGTATVAGVRKNASVSAFRPKMPLILPQPILAQPMTPLPGLVLVNQNILLDDAAEIKALAASRCETNQSAPAQTHHFVLKTLTIPKRNLMTPRVLSTYIARLQRFRRIQCGS